jgi:hypothetical protein
MAAKLLKTLGQKVALEKLEKYFIQTQIKLAENTHYQDSNGE